jgi:hypothetical protein
VQLQTGWDNVGGDDSDSVSEEDASPNDETPAERPTVAAPVSSSLPISCEAGPGNRRYKQLQQLEANLSSSVGDKAAPPHGHQSKVPVDVLSQCMIRGLVAKSGCAW